ncbi:protein virilizer homolog [Ptychodera flava]|uniref:protein virilizer homolog n=1 Tax=Ptychodera flava TaxID=63121 RepID=UPI00396A0C0B
MAEHGDLDVGEINLLFCETFSHDTGEDLNLDLVQFPRPVCIHEVRVIPPGKKAHTEFHEESKLGRTAPGNFRLELFINNLSKPGSAIFERLGTLDYEEKNVIQLITNSMIPTDGVILRGLYSSITIAIYGVLTQVAKAVDETPPSPPPPPPPPQPVTKSTRKAVVEVKPIEKEYTSERQRERREYESERARRQKYKERSAAEQRQDELERTRGTIRQRPPSPPGPPPDDIQEPRTPPREKRGPRTPPGAPKTDSSPESLNLPLDDDIHEPGEIPDDRESSDRQDELFEPLTPEHSPGPGGISDGEINEEGASSLIGEEEDDAMNYEQISDDGDEVSSLPGTDFEVDDSWMYVSSFNPFQCEFSTPVCFTPPDQSNYETEKLDIAKESKSTIPESATKIQDFINTYREEEHGPKWVSALEEISSLIEPGLAYLDEDKINVIVNWVREALDLDTAIAQPIAVNIRQLKAGMKLTSALCACGPSVASVLIKAKIQEKLCTLLFAEHMASSLKLVTLQALDSCTNSSEGMEEFLGNQDKENHQASSGYQKALKLMLSDQTVRVLTALTALLRKAHIYEALKRLQQTVDSIMENAPPPPESAKEIEAKDTEAMELPSTGDQSPEKMIFLDASEKQSRGNTPDRSEHGLSIESDLASPTAVCTASVQDVETILECLGELYFVMKNASHTIVQPPIKAFPTTAKITGPPSTTDPYPVLFHFFNSRKLLESLVVLVSCPTTSGNLEIFDAVRDVMVLFLKTQKGLLYLAHNHETLKILMQMLTNNYEEDNLEDSSVQQLGLQLIYHLQALQNIDQLKNLLNSKKNLLQTDRDNAEVINTLHTTYCMTFTMVGKVSVAHVFNLDSNLDSLLPFLELTGDEDADHKIKKSASYGYATGLLTLAMQYCDNITTFKSYASKLLPLCPEQSELARWLSPSQGLKYDISCITSLVEVIKNHTSDISTNMSTVGPPMVTALRILRHLVCPDYENDGSEEHQKSLQYNLAVIQLFSADAMDTFIAVLKKLGDFLLRPWQQGFPHPSSVNHIIDCMVSPLLMLVRKMLRELLSGSSAEFRDTRLVTALLTLHTVLCSPTSNILSADTARVQSLMVDILLTFTKPALKAETEEAVANSTWTMMLKEVLEYIPSAPYTFMSGLFLLLELLPLPLPMQVQEALSNDEIQQALTTRKLWSIHLHSLAPQIQTIIRNLAGTGYHPLQHILRRVCWQLADLATPTALLVVRFIFEMLQEELNKTGNKEENKESRDDNKSLDPCTGQANRILTLLMYLVSQPPVKAPLLHFLRSNVKADEKFAEVLTRLLIILNSVSELPSHLQSQECIVAIIQSTCDPEITLMSVDQSTALQDQLANSLPIKEHLELILNAILEHVGNTDQTYATILLCLRTLIMLTEHDYGFYHLKCALERNNSAFYNLFKKLASSFNKDSADCLSTLSTFLELLQLLISPENLDEDQQTESANVRTYTISEAQLIALLRWNSSQADEHPVKVLEKLLMESCKDDDAMGTLLVEVTNLAQELNSAQDEGSSKSEDLTEPTLPAPESLTTQFNTRALYLVGEIEDERINYWLTIPPLDDPDIDMDMVKCDFEELSELCGPDFDLKDELAKGFAEDEGSPRKKIRLGVRKYDPLIARSEKRGFGQMRRGHKPMPGRGGRPNFYQGNRPHDIFRQRAQNTSRPPSMHVDDFEAMKDHPPQHHHVPPMKKMNKGLPPGRPNRGGFFGGPGGGYQRGGFVGGPGARWGGPSGGGGGGGGGGGYNRRDLGPGMGNLQGRAPGMWGGNNRQQPSPGGYQGRTSRGFLSRRPDNRPSPGPAYGRPPPLPPTRGDGLYGSPARGGPRGGMRGSPSSGRGGPSPTRKTFRGFRGMPSGGRWVGPGGKTDPHTRFMPPKPSRGGYGRHESSSRHGGGRPFNR